MLLSVLEVVLVLLIVWYAWRWPEQALGACERDGCRSPSGSPLSPIGCSLFKRRGTAEAAVSKKMDKLDLIAGS